MNMRPAAGAAVLILGTTLLAGCTAPVPNPTPSPVAADPVELCAAFADVESIMFNAITDLQDGRIADQEFQGWLRLAARVLSRIDADEATSIGAAIAAAQRAAPAVPIGVVQDGADPLSEEWGTATTAVRVSCEAEGIEFAIEGFSSG